MFTKIGLYLDALINNFARVNALGFSNILNNPLGLILIALAIVMIVLFVKTKINHLIYLAFFLSVCGYGSIITQGLKIFVETLGKIISG